MDKGTLGYEAEGRYLGTAFGGLKGLCLYPSVSAVYGSHGSRTCILGRVPKYVSTNNVFMDLICGTGGV